MLGASVYYRAPLCICPGNKFIFADALGAAKQ